MLPDMLLLWLLTTTTLYFFCAILLVCPLFNCLSGFLGGKYLTIDSLVAVCYFRLTLKSCAIWNQLKNSSSWDIYLGNWSAKAPMIKYSSSGSSRLSSWSRSKKRGTSYSHLRSKTLAGVYWENKVMGIIEGMLACDLVC